MQDGWETTGIEPSDRAKLLRLKKEFVENTHGYQTTFDVVSMWHVLEHVPDLDLQIKELKRILKPLEP
jgi:2-polyprenyl-3-methyl-5-hydroxy-6-metoxy-1,4-benzoquinol methylase